MLIISRDCVKRVADLCNLGVHIEERLSWSVNTSELLKKAADVLLQSLHRDLLSCADTCSYHFKVMTVCLTDCVHVCSYCLLFYYLLFTFIYSFSNFTT